MPTQTTTDKMKKEISMSDILAQYIKHKNGSIFHMLEHKTDPSAVWLRSKNNYTKKRRLEIKQGIVNGTWLLINEHEWKRWVKEDNSYIEKFTQKLVKRTILTQLLIELDDELIADHEDIPQFRKLLERSNKEAERIAVKNYDRLYAIDKTILQNLMNTIDGITDKMSGLDVADFIYLDKAVKEFIENPEKFREEEVELIKIEQ